MGLFTLKFFADQVITFESLNGKHFLVTNFDDSKLCVIGIRRAFNTFDLMYH